MYCCLHVEACCAASNTVHNKLLGRLSHVTRKNTVVALSQMDVDAWMMQCRKSLQYIRCMCNCETKMTLSASHAPLYPCASFRESYTLSMECPLTLSTLRQLHTGPLQSLLLHQHPLVRRRQKLKKSQSLPGWHPAQSVSRTVPGSCQPQTPAVYSALSGN